MATPRDLQQQKIEEQISEIVPSNELEEIDSNAFKGPNREQYTGMEDAPADFVKKSLEGANPLNKVDIEDPNWTALQQWRALPLGDEREKAKTDWYMKVYGEDKKINSPFNAPNTFENQENDALQFLNKSGMAVDPGMAFKNLATAAGIVWDWKMDLLGKIPGLGWVDTLYDDITQMDPARQKIRNIGSTLYTFYKGNKAINKAITRNAAANNVPEWQARAQRQFAELGLGFGITAIADQSEELDNIPRMLADVNPRWFGEDGHVGFVNFLATNDGDSTRMRAFKNAMDELPLQGMAAIIGEGLSLYKYSKGGAGVLDKLIPQDELAEIYKNKEIFKAGNPNIKKRIAEIDGLLNGNQPEYFNNKKLIEEKTTLLQQLRKKDPAVTLQNVDKELTRKSEAKALSKLKKDPYSVDYDPDINPINKKTTDSVSEPGKVAKNMADNDGLERGAFDGDPEPLDLDLKVSTENLRAQEGVPSQGPVRDAVLDLENETKQIGDFKWKSEVFESNRKNMEKSSFDFYSKILDIENGDELKKYLQSNYNRFFKQNGELVGYFDQALIGNEGPLTQSLKTIFNRYFKPSVTEASARAVNTSSKEVRTLADTYAAFKDLNLSEEEILDKVFGKAIIIMDEIAISKRIAGRDLQALKKGKKGNVIAQRQEIEHLLDIPNMEKEIHQANLDTLNTLKDLIKRNPEVGESMMYVLQMMDDSPEGIANIWKWFRQELNPAGYFYSKGNNGMNSFGKYTWGAGYTFLLGTKSIYNAAKGGLSTIIAAPMSSLIGNFVYGFADDFKGLERAIYYYGARHETIKRATHHAYNMLLKNWEDPDFFARVGRKDYVIQDEAKWKLLQTLGETAWKEGNVGDIALYEPTRWARDIQRSNFFRYGMVGLTSLDGGLNSFNTTLMSRLRAHDDVFKKLGYIDDKAVDMAESKLYKSMFNTDGVPTDPVASVLSKEMALNKDTQLSKAISKLTTKIPVAKHALAFPRSVINEKILNLSYTPLAGIPGFDKYGKTIWAKTDDEIAEALAMHGVKSDDRNAMAIFEHLQRSYLGRMAIGAGAVKILQEMALSGNIRGAGHHDWKVRQNQRANGYKEKTWQPIPGMGYISYQGIPIIEPILTLVGSMNYYAEHLDEPIWEDFSDKLTHVFAAMFLDSAMAAQIRPFFDIFLGQMTPEKAQNSLNKMIANGSKFFTPFNSELTQLAYSIDDAVRVMDRNFIDTIMRSKPGLSTMLPAEYNPWTGKINRYQDNAFLRGLNRFIPDDFTKEEEEYAKVLRYVGYPGMALIEKSTIAPDIELNKNQRAAVLREMAKMGPLKDHPEFRQLLRSDLAKQHAGNLRDYHLSGLNGQFENLQANLDLLPLRTKIRNLWKTRQREAELNLINPDHPDNIIFNQIKASWAAKDALTQATKAGDVGRIEKIQKTKGPQIRKAGIQDKKNLTNFHKP